MQELSKKQEAKVSQVLHNALQSHKGDEGQVAHELWQLIAHIVSEEKQKLINGVPFPCHGEKPMEYKDRLKNWKNSQINSLKAE